MQVIVVLRKPTEAGQKQLMSVVRVPYGKTAESAYGVWEQQCKDTIGEELFTQWDYEYDEITVADLGE